MTTAELGQEPMDLTAPADESHGDHRDHRKLFRATFELADADRNVTA